MGREKYGRVAITVFAASLLTSTIVRAQAEEPETLIKQGIELRRRGEDARAHGYFKRAYELSKTPRTTAQLGLVDQAIGRFTEAEMLLSDALSSNDPWIQQHRSTLESSLKIVRKHLGNIIVRGAPSGTKWSDADHTATPLPSSGAIWVTAGDASVRFEATGRRTVNKTVTVGAGEKVTIEIDMPSTAPPPPPPPSVAAAPESVGGPPMGQPADATPKSDASNPEPATTTATATTPDDGSSGRAARIAGIAIAGTGVAVAVAGFFVRNVATNKLNGFSSGSTYNPANDNWATYEHAGVGMLIGGGVALAAGAVLFIVNWPKSGGGAEGGSQQARSGSGLGILAMPDLHGGGTVQLSARF